MEGSSIMHFLVGLEGKKQYNYNFFFDHKNSVIF